MAKFKRNNLLLTDKKKFKKTLPEYVKAYDFKSKPTSFRLEDYTYKVEAVVNYA